MGDVGETLELVDGHTDELDEMKEQLKDYVNEALYRNQDMMKEVFNVVKSDKVEKNKAFEAMIKALKEQVTELKGELNICKVALGSAMLVSASKKCSMDVPKLKEFKGTRSTRNVDIFL
ncbi:hypothetical protein J1N35_011080 [Gossypium stocksii]|uniref:Uncharacterized protein n=1 Tax=Gossypium stocksii TaxID=47602 RepID=A0A9D3W2W2_9ROSI|nr:hypothetical protein J1N35_011080 [Gossypium stocksii]